MESKEYVALILGTVTAMLSCGTTLIWQIIIVCLIFSFHNQIASLLSRIGTVKVGGAEVAFQSPATEAIKPGGDSDAQVENLRMAGFFTQEGITSIIANSGLISKTEKVTAHLLIFQTKRQHTWLITTNKNIFCVLDDENSQMSGKLIQWKLSLNEATPIFVKAHKRTVGLVSIGSKRNWLYSRRLYPSESELEQEIKHMVEKSQKLQTDIVDTSQ